MKYSSFLNFLFAILLLASCEPKKEGIPNIDNINVDARIVRFDSMLYSISSIDDLNVMQFTYPAFFELYFYRILGFQNRGQDSLYSDVRNMLSSKTFKALGQKGHNQYDDISDISEEWRKAMKFYSFYFKPETVPDLYTTVTEFAFGSFIFPISEIKDGIGVSVDLFLGDSINYQAMAKSDASFSAYNSRTFNRDHLVKKAVDALIDDIIPPIQSSEFLPHLLREGKKYFVSDKILPLTSDTVIWEFTPEQLTWIKNNEWNIYSFLISNELFFSKDRSTYIRLITPAPSTQNMPPESPGRAVVYIAYKIVEQYMRRYPKTTMRELVDMDAYTLFQEAKFKPALRE